MKENKKGIVLAGLLMLALVGVATQSDITTTAADIYTTANEIIFELPIKAPNVTVKNGSLNFENDTQTVATETVGLYEFQQTGESQTLLHDTNVSLNYDDLVSGPTTVDGYISIESEDWIADIGNYTNLAHSGIVSGSETVYNASLTIQESGNYTMNYTDGSILAENGSVFVDGGTYQIDYYLDGVIQQSGNFTVYSEQGYIKAYSTGVIVDNSVYTIGDYNYTERAKSINVEEW